MKREQTLDTWTLHYWDKIFKNPVGRHNIGPVASFSLGLVTDWSGYLALGVLFSSIHNEEQRRVHSYTPEVKRLPQRGNVKVRWPRKLLRKIRALQHHTRDTLTSSLCVILCRLTCGSGMTTVSPIKTPQLSAVLYTITTMHVSSLSTIPNVLHKTNSINQVLIVKHKGRQRSKNKKALTKPCDPLRPCWTPLCPGQPPQR